MNRSGPNFVWDLISVYRWSKFQKFASNTIRFSINFKNPRNIFTKSAKFCLFLFYNIYKEKMFTIEIEDGRESPLKPSYFKDMNKKYENKTWLQNSTIRKYWALLEFNLENELQYNNYIFSGSDVRGQWNTGLWWLLYNTGIFWGNFTLVRPIQLWKTTFTHSFVCFILFHSDQCMIENIMYIESFSYFTILWVY